MLRVFAPINFRTAWRLFFTLTREQSISCGHYGYYPRVNKFTLKMTEVLCKNDISASKDIYKIVKCIELIMYMILLWKATNFLFFIYYYYKTIWEVILPLTLECVEDHMMYLVYPKQPWCIWSHFLQIWISSSSGMMSP